MYVYSLGQWLLFFFLYCFLGWVWESCYVSAAAPVGEPWLSSRPHAAHLWHRRRHHPAGHHPRVGQPVAGFLLGMLAATALEYSPVPPWRPSSKSVTGITPSSPSTSTAISASPAPWPGAPFSILLVRFLHPPVEDLVLRLPAFLVGSSGVPC